MNPEAAPVVYAVIAMFVIFMATLFGVSVWSSRK
jgi:hypothetical protein